MGQRHFKSSSTKSGFGLIIVSEKFDRPNARHPNDLFKGVFVQMGDDKKLHRTNDEFRPNEYWPNDLQPKETTFYTIYIYRYRTNFLFILTNICTYKIQNNGIKQQGTLKKPRK